MKIVDVSFSNTDIFRGMIGQTFEKYKCDPFVFSPSVYGIVGFYIGKDIYKMTALQQTTERFYANEDVVTFQFGQADDDEIVTMADEGQMIETPVKDTIKRIDIINDHETVSHDGDEHTLISTKGMIFYMTGGNEISFEIRTWFSEFITIRKGYDLIKKFAPKEEFLEEWEESDGYDASVHREVFTIQ